MAIKKAKPTTPAQRQAVYDDFSDVTKKKPEKNLTRSKKRIDGRNVHGKITVRHRGGGAKRNIRIVDYKREKYDIPARVDAIEYDPNRGARIALVVYKDGEKRYIIAPKDLKVGDEIMSSRGQLDMKTGNAMPIKYIPSGVPVYNVELEPGKGGKIAKAAGNAVHVMGVEGKFAQIKLPSNEVRLIKKECLATVGRCSNPEKRHIKVGFAGRRRRMGVRPTVRGSAMNPCDHPHGGGEGNQPIGMKHPKTPWGKPALGVRTRRKKHSDRLIIKRRSKKRR